MKLILGRIPIMFVGAFFASRSRARPVGALGIFACPTLERLPPSFYLIRDEPMVLLTSGTLQPLAHPL